MRISDWSSDVCSSDLHYCHQWHDLWKQSISRNARKNWFSFCFLRPMGGSWYPYNRSRSLWSDRSDEQTRHCSEWRSLDFLETFALPCQSGRWRPQGKSSYTDSFTGGYPASSGGCATPAVRRGEDRES